MIKLEIGKTYLDGEGSKWKITKEAGNNHVVGERTPSGIVKLFSQSFGMRDEVAAMRFHLVSEYKEPRYKWFIWNYETECLVGRGFDCKQENHGYKWYQYQMNMDTGEISKLE